MSDRIAWLRKRLAAELRIMGAVQSAEWQHAFEQVPRHVFAPRFTLGYGPAGTPETLDGALSEQHEEWLTTVYSDTGLITQFGEDGASTSSSSTPSIMAWMLAALDATPGQRLLEIGTGSGYNAALLSEVLGADGVTTVDIDPELVELVRERLRAAGYAPAVAAADGYHGFPENALYDRVIGTCYIWPLPTAWIAQTRPGGRVVALVPNGLVQLTVREDGSASGPFHPETFGFMYMRGGHMPPGLPPGEVESLLDRSGATRRCRFPSRITEAGRNWSFWFFWGFFVAPFAEVRRPEREVLVMIDEVDRSWFRLDRQGDTVTQGGPRRMWDEIEDLFETWCRLGAPNREDLGLTVTPEGRHILWLDSPDSEHTWELSTVDRR